MQDYDPPPDLAGYSSSEDEGAWDEVDVAHPAVAAPEPPRELNIVIPGLEDLDKKRKLERQRRYQEMRYERTVRLLTHRVHVQALLGVGIVRNRWASHPELCARLLSLTPVWLQNSFYSFDRTTHPSDVERSRKFDACLRNLLSWWHDDFFQITEMGDSVLFRRRASDVRDELELVRMVLADDGGDSDSSLEVLAPPPDPFPWAYFRDNGRAFAARARRSQNRDVRRLVRDLSRHEYLKSHEKSVMKLALQRRGSKQMSALLFLALLRALEIPARLVMSLQPIDHRREKAEPLLAARLVEDSGGASSAPSPVSHIASTASSPIARSNASSPISHGATGAPARSAPKLRLRKTKSTRSKSDSAPPITWVEVYSRVNRHWITVDVVNNRIRCARSMHPSKANPQSELLYVVAFEEDSSVRDVTMRYTMRTETELAKARAPNRPGEADWFAALLRPFRREFELNRDREEQAEFDLKRRREPVPQSLAGFKNHPRYVLERNIKRDEALEEDARPIGLFRGAEKIYDRSSVITVKSEENYWRVGRVIRPGERPMKFVKPHVTTINKIRAKNVEKLVQEETHVAVNTTEETQGMYAYSQTELYRPPPVENGIVPKNKFGNIDLYVPTMLPIGAVHLESEYAAKCAKALGIDYAEAITGFVFRHRHATPIIRGVVVAVEQAGTLIEAMEEMQRNEDEKARRKLEERALALWRKLIVALRVRQRLQSTYSESFDVAVPTMEEEQDNSAVPYLTPGTSSNKRTRETTEDSTTISAKVAKTESPPPSPAPLKVRLKFPQYPEYHEPRYKMEQSQENPTQLKLSFNNASEEFVNDETESDGGSSLELVSDF